jgi:hypothetical protein
MAAQADQEISKATNGPINATTLSISPEVQLKLVVKMFLDNPSDQDLKAQISQWRASNAKMLSGEEVGRTVANQIKEILNFRIDDANAAYGQLVRLKEAFMFAPEFASSNSVSEVGLKTNSNSRENGVWVGEASSKVNFNTSIKNYINDARATLAAKEVRKEANGQLTDQAVGDKLDRIANGFVKGAMDRIFYPKENQVAADLLKDVDPQRLLQTFLRGNESYVKSFVRAVSDNFTEQERRYSNDRPAAQAVLLVQSLTETFGADNEVTVGIKNALKEKVSVIIGANEKELASGRSQRGNSKKDKEERTREQEFFDSEKAAFAKLQ